MTTIATINDVRTAGSLLNEAAGGATDSQVASALTTAQMHLINLTSKDEYIAVLGYTESSGEENWQKHLSFRDAESRFAISFLPFILSSAQFQSTGFKMEAGIGKGFTHFGNEEDIVLLSNFWMEKAMIFIAPYLGEPYFDEEEDDYYGFESDDGDLSMISI